MGSKYSVGDMVRCIKKFVMQSKETAFVAGRTYSITDADLYEEGSVKEYEYCLDSEVGKRHVLTEKDIDRHFTRVETMPIIFHKYYCGCYGIPIDSLNGLIVKACDDDSGEYIMSIRDMGDKKSEPMKWDDQDKLVKAMDAMLGRGHRVTDFAFLIDRINNKS